MFGFTESYHLLEMGPRCSVFSKTERVETQTPVPHSHQQRLLELLSQLERLFAKLLRFVMLSLHVV